MAGSKPSKSCWRLGSGRACPAGLVVIVVVLLAVWVEFSASAAEEIRRFDIHSGETRVREISWACKVLKMDSCPFGYESAENAEKRLFCCESVSKPETCIPLDQIVGHPIIGSILESVNLTERTVHRYLAYSRLIQTGVECLNYDEILAAPEPTLLPATPGLETFSQGQPANLIPCVPRTDFLRFGYTRSSLLMFPALDLVRKKAGAHREARMLLFGLGGGAIPTFFSHQIPGLKIDIVEIEPATIQAAKQYFGFQESENVKVFEADAFQWVEQATSRTHEGGRPHYDIILMDAFTDSYIPSHLLGDVFYQRLLTLVESPSSKEENGFIMFNMFCGDYHIPLLKQVLPIVARNIPTLHILNIEEATEGNCIMFGHDSKFGFGSDRDLSIEEEANQEDENVECDEDGLCTVIEKPTKKRTKKKEAKRKSDIGLCSSQKLEEYAKALEETYEWARTYQLAARAKAPPREFKDDPALDSLLCHV